MSWDMFCQPTVPDRGLRPTTATDVLRAGPMGVGWSGVTGSQLHCLAGLANLRPQKKVNG